MSKKIGIIVGSLRKGSYTRIVAEQIETQLPEGYEAEFIEIGHLPFYNEDIDTPENLPTEYKEFRELVAGFDGFIFATPEYNRSIPGVLKNALEVGSRPYGQNKFDGKPALIVSVSPGLISGFGANHHLRQVLVFMNMPTVQQPEVYIGNVTALLSENQKLEKPETIEFLQSAVDAFTDLVERY